MVAPPGGLSGSVVWALALCGLARARAGGGLADLAGQRFGEVGGAVSTSGDVPGAAVGGRDRGFGDLSRDGDTTDLVSAVLGEPQRAVGGRGDSARQAVVGWDRELLD